MIDKKIALLMLKNGHTQSKIARTFRVTRQRISQIVLGYSTYSYRSKRMKNKLANGCVICRQKAMEIHHVDGDPENNSLKNRMPVCRKCHTIIHLGELSKKILRRKRFPLPKNKRGCGKTLPKGRWSINYHECIVCGESSKKYGGRGMCSCCYQNFRNLKKKKYEIGDMG